MNKNLELKTTPLPIIASVSRLVTRIVDRVTGDRVDVPLFVAGACVEALRCFGVESRVMYGKVAWIEIMEDHSVVWAGCWGENFHFWVATQFGEIVDLNTSVACRKSSHFSPQMKPLYSPPILWSIDVPSFYRYVPEGIAEIDLVDESDKRKFELVLEEIRKKCKPSCVEGVKNDELEFPNESILCPNRQVLDDSLETFKKFDRALSVQGIPSAPI